MLQMLLVGLPKALRMPMFAGVVGVVVYVDGGAGGDRCVLYLSAACAVAVVFVDVVVGGCGVEAAGGIVVAVVLTLPGRLMSVLSKMKVPFTFRRSAFSVLLADSRRARRVSANASVSTTLDFSFAVRASACFSWIFSASSLLRRACVRASVAS